MKDEKAALRMSPDDSEAVRSPKSSRNEQHGGASSSSRVPGGAARGGAAAASSSRAAGTAGRSPSGFSSGAARVSKTGDHVFQSGFGPNNLERSGSYAPYYGYSAEEVEAGEGQDQDEMLTLTR